MALTRTIEDTVEQAVAGLITALGVSGLSVVTSDDGEEPDVPFALVSCQSVVPVTTYSVVHTASVRVSVYESSKQRSSFLGISFSTWKTNRQTMFKAVRDLLEGDGFKASLAAAMPSGVAVYEAIVTNEGTEPEGKKINNFTDLTIKLS